MYKWVGVRLADLLGGGGGGGGGAGRGFERTA